MEIKRPIFNVGTVRSGSTLMGKCLGEHPEVLYLGFELNPEWCEFAGIEIAAPGSSGRPETATNFGHCPALSEKDATSERCLSGRQGFSDFFVKSGGGSQKRFFNKNPHLSNKLPFLKQIFPDACLIITCRDLRSTVASIKRLWTALYKDIGSKHYLPADSNACWSCSPPVDPEEVDSARAFPGGDVKFIAEYWLRTYENIERSVHLFDNVTLVKHSEFVCDPLGAMQTIHKNNGLADRDYKFPVKISQSTNKRWPKLLTLHEQKQLDMFVDENRHRIEALKFADTHLETNFYDKARGAIRSIRSLG